MMDRGDGTMLGRALTETEERLRAHLAAANERAEKAEQIIGTMRESYETEQRARVGMQSERDAARRELEAERALSARLRAALEWVKAWARRPEMYGGPTKLEAVDSALAATPAGSARLWRAMERACEAAATVSREARDDNSAGWEISGTTLGNIEAALAEYEAAKAEVGR